MPFPTVQNGVTIEDALKYLDFIFKADADPSRIAAIIVEPVQGEGGFHQIPAELMRALRRVCDEAGIVLIADEVQTGFGRTGKMSAMEHYDVAPDLICIAKSLAGGFPLSDVIGKAPMMVSNPTASRHLVVDNVEHRPVRSAQSFGIGSTGWICACCALLAATGKERASPSSAHAPRMPRQTPPPPGTGGAAAGKRPRPRSRCAAGTGGRRHRATRIPQP